jgi:hypothetical protein
VFRWSGVVCAAPPLLNYLRYIMKTTDFVWEVKEPNGRSFTVSADKAHIEDGSLSFWNLRPDGEYYLLTACAPNQWVNVEVLSALTGEVNARQY